MQCERIHSPFAAAGGWPALTTWLLDYLSPPKMSQSAMRVRKPKNAEQSNYQDLTDNGKTVDQEGRDSANYGGFNQIEHIHNTTSESPARILSRSTSPRVAIQSRGVVIGPGFIRYTFSVRFR